MEPILILLGLFVVAVIVSAVLPRRTSNDEAVEKLLELQRIKKQRASNGEIASKIINSQSRDGRIHIKCCGVFLGTFGRELAAMLSGSGLSVACVSFEYSCFRMAVATIFLKNSNISQNHYGTQYSVMLGVLLGVAKNQLSLPYETLNEISKQRIRFYRDTLIASGNPASVIQNHLCRIAITSSNRKHPDIGDAESMEFHDVLQTFNLFDIIGQLEKRNMEAAFHAMEEAYKEIATPTPTR